MTAVDTDLLVHAVHADSPWRREVDACLTNLESGAHEAIPWPRIHEFLAIATNPHVYKPPMRMADARQQVDFWMDSPSLHLLGEAEEHWTRVRSLLAVSKYTGHDSRCPDLGAMPTAISRALRD